MTVTQRDATGALRPKRVEITTEFREYWACIAMHDPDMVRAMAADVLGAEPSWEDLYGVADPHAMSVEEREIAFGHNVAGHGNDRRLRVAGVPAQPTGRLNMERALFMTHPINGIDDLIYVAIFGAHAYCVTERDERRQASGDDVFSAFKVTHLACNHADPTISLGVYDLVYHGGAGRRSRTRSACTSGARTSTSSPTTAGRCPTTGCASAAGARAPTSAWTSGRPTSTRRSSTTSRWRSARPSSRSWAATSSCASSRSVRCMQAGTTDPIADAEWELLEPAPGTIACDDAESCKPVRDLLARFEAERAGRKAPRTMPEPKP